LSPGKYYSIQHPYLYLNFRCRTNDQNRGQCTRHTHSSRLERSILARFCS